jgi:hypothetical protein
LAKHTYRQFTDAHGQLLALVNGFLAAAVNAHVSTRGMEEKELLDAAARAVLESSILGRVLADLMDDWVSPAAPGRPLHIVSEVDSTGRDTRPKDHALTCLQSFIVILQHHSNVRL